MLLTLIYREVCWFQTNVTEGTAIRDGFSHRRRDLGWVVEERRSFIGKATLLANKYTQSIHDPNSDPETGPQASWLGKDFRLWIQICIQNRNYSAD